MRGDSPAIYFPVLFFPRIPASPLKKWFDECGRWSTPDAYIAHVPSPACQGCGGQPCTLGLTIYLHHKSLPAPWQREKIFSLLHSVARWQLEFLTGAAQYPKPLLVKEAAGWAALSPSSLSQLAARLQVRTPVGILKLRALFVSPSGSSNPSVSVQEVRWRIKQLVKANPRATGQEIAEKLRQVGILIVRRSVCKYRHDLGLSQERGLSAHAFERVLQLIETEDKQNPLTDYALSQLVKKSGLDLSPREIGAIRQNRGIPAIWQRRKKADTS